MTLHLTPEQTSVLTSALEMAIQDTQECLEEYPDDFTSADLERLRRELTVLRAIRELLP